MNHAVTLIVGLSAFRYTMYCVTCRNHFKVDEIVKSLKLYERLAGAVLTSPPSARFPWPLKELEKVKGVARMRT